MKKTMQILVSLSICILLTGCCLSHEWQEATCELPKTCAKCGETEGEALGHTWQEVTCTEAKTCSACAATEGEPLGHKDLTEANYQQAAVCGVCGEEVGEPLTPDFVKYEVPGKFVKVGEMTDYRTHCYNDKTMSTLGWLTVTDYGVIMESEYYSAPEGYEWRIVKAEAIFSDENANKYAVSISACFDNYYDIIGYEDSSIWSEEGGWKEGEEWREVKFPVNWKGMDYPDCIGRVSLTWSSWKNNAVTLTVDYEYLLPIGYDGVVIGFYDSGIEWEDGDYIFDVADKNTRFFRLA